MSTIAKTTIIWPQRILVADIVSPGSSLASPESKRRVMSGVRTASTGYNSDRCTWHAVEDLLSRATRKTFTKCEFFAYWTRSGRSPHRMLHIGSVAIFPAKVGSHNENPDRYAAAICIRVRADVCCADILSAKLPPIHVAKRLADLRFYPDASFCRTVTSFSFWLSSWLSSLPSSLSWPSCPP